VVGDVIMQVVEAQSLAAGRNLAGDHRSEPSGAGDRRDHGRASLSVTF
jgi:hypothetical protein